MTPRRWFDAHIHVSNMDTDRTSRGDILDALLAVLDASGTDLRFILSADFPWPSLMIEDAAMVLAANEFINDLVQRAPDRLYGAFTPNPHFLDESLRTMQLAFEQWGFVMVGEMVQYIFDYMMNSEEVVEITARAAAYDVPIQVHISTSTAGPQGQFDDGGTGQLEDFFGLVERVPEAKYILAHFIGTDTDNPPVVDGYLDQIEAHFGEFPDNFWAEIRDFNSPGVRTALDRIPGSRLIAGTDWVTRVGPPFLPYGMIFGHGTADENPYPPSVPNMANFLTDAGATPHDIEAIAFDNLATLLSPRAGQAS